ncbi:MAG: hypothetical protein HZB42_15250 [Sphingobacteriales bacterium]|nr:hypothetical protein [Sphingobacteriales bacterium]
MRKYCLILFVFSSSFLHAQKDSIQKGWAATFTVTAVPIGQPGFGIQPGIEYRFNERYSLLSEFALRANKKNSKDSSTFDKHYFKVKSELRYHFFSKKQRWSHDYAAFQLSWASRKFINRNDFYYNRRHDDSVTYYSQASVNSPVMTATVQFGSVITNGRFALDVFIGAGGRFINTTLTNVENPVRGKEPRGSDGPHFPASYSFAGNTIMLQLNGGIRAMWHFYNFKHPRKR